MLSGSFQEIRQILAEKFLNVNIPAKSSINNLVKNDVQQDRFQTQNKTGNLH